MFLITSAFWNAGVESLNTASLLPAVPLITFPFKVTFEQFHKEWIFIVLCCRAAKRGVYASNRWLQLACFPRNVIQIKHCIILPLELCLSARLTSFLANYISVLRLGLRAGVLHVRELESSQIGHSSWGVEYPGSSLCGRGVFTRGTALLGSRLKGNCSDQLSRLDVSFISGPKHRRRLCQINDHYRAQHIVGTQSKSRLMEWAR